jgi:hypothetical protein
MKDNALYLEVDEDITSAIDKLNKVSGDSVQIVVPKRSTLLQSVINQKLLKKAAENAHKKLVLVTNDRVATDLAARTGLAVAASLGAEAVLAKAVKAAPALADDVIEDGDPEPVGPAPMATPPTQASPASQPTQPSQAAAEPVKQPKPEKPAKASKAAPVVATRALRDDTPALAEDAAAESVGKAAKDGKKPKVPNFNKLRNRALWIGGLVAVIVAYLIGMYFWSSGSVTLYADGARSDINATFYVDTSLSQTDTSTTTVAGQSLTTSNNVSTTFSPTGSQNIGTKATGTVTITNNSGTAQPLDAGTRFVSPDGNVFYSNSAVTVPAATASVTGGGQVVKQPGTASVGVTASQPGDNYNEAGGQAYTIPGLGSQTLVTAQGAQMSGGTTKTVQVVTQSDVTTATAAAAKDKPAGQKTLMSQVPSGDMALTSSLTATTSNVVSNPAVGGQGSQATITMTINYTMLAVNKADFTKVIENIEQQQLGAGNQIYDNGIGNANITAGKVTGSKQPFQFVTTASGGPSFDRTAIANALRGKKYSDATDYASGLPGVVKATVTLSPAWSTSMPHIAKHINVIVTINQN